MQRLNQRNPEQISQLQKKREYAEQEYLGAIRVAHWGYNLGSEIHWELSEKCEAWKLPFLQEFLMDLKLQTVTTHGCTVNLRARDTGELMCKGWKIATSNRNLLRHMHLPCQRNHRKSVCESGRTLQSAFYTPVFAKKVIEALRQQEMWSLVCSELNAEFIEETSEPSAANVETCAVNREAPSNEEKARILKLIRHIHGTTGHGSLDVLLRALKKRGVPPHVLEIAKSFSCPILSGAETCRTTKTGDSRGSSQKSGKWFRVTWVLWTHPHTGDKCKFVIFIDEGCRFRAGTDSLH